MMYLLALLLLLNEIVCRKCLVSYVNISTRLTNIIVGFLGSLLKSWSFANVTLNLKILCAYSRILF